MSLGFRRDFFQSKEGEAAKMMLNFRGNDHGESVASESLSGVQGCAWQDLFEIML